jgi:preprotein translocase subunit YajC
MQTASLHGFELTLTLAQATPAATQPTAQAAPPSNGQALVPIGIPTAAKATGPETQPLVPNTTTTTTPAAPRGPLDMTFMFVMVGFLLLMIYMAWSGSRKEKKKREELNNSLGRGDTVQTIGGIIGEVVELGENDLVLKVVDGRIRFAKSAVQGILKSKGDKSEAKVDTTVEPKLAATANAR